MWTTCPLDRRCDSCDETIPAETPYYGYALGPVRYAECRACNEHLIKQMQER